MPSNRPSMRANYTVHGGSDGYYEANGETYRNPHFPIVVRAIARAMRGIVVPYLLNCVEAETATAAQPPASTSEGEPAKRKRRRWRDAHVVITSETESRMEQAVNVGALTRSNIIAGRPSLSSSSSFSSSSSAAVPAAAPRQPPTPPTLTLRTLDLAAGSGEATIALHEYIRGAAAAAAALAVAVTLVHTAADPFTGAAYRARTRGWPCVGASFETILRDAGWEDEEDEDEEDVGGEASDGGERLRDRYDVCVCSFAMHLLDDEGSALKELLRRLAARVRVLVIVSPHKRPTVREARGGGWWNKAGEFVEERVHVRVYTSALM